MSQADARIQVVGDQRLIELLQRVRARVSDMRPVFEETGDILLASVERNFAAEGRWSGQVGSFLGGSKKWTGLSPVTIAQRFKRKHNGPILQETGQLAASVTKRAGKNWVEIGTNKAYARVHQFGATKGELGRNVTVTVAAHVRRVFGLTKKGTKSKRATGKGMVREHQRVVPFLPWGDVPARPFLLVQEEDFTQMFDFLSKFITG